MFSAEKRDEIKNYKPSITKSNLRYKLNKFYGKIKGNFDPGLIYLKNNTIAKEKLINCRADFIACLLFPEVLDEKRFKNLFNFLCWSLFLDEYIGFEKTGEAFDQIIEVIERKREPESPVERQIDDILETMRPDLNDNQYKRFIEYLILYVEANKQELLQKNVTQFESVDEILELRLDSVSMDVCHALIEYAMDIDISDYLSDDLRILENSAVRHSILINEIFSFKKEFEREESSECFNAVLHLFQTMNLEESLNEVQRMFEESENKFIAIRDKLMRVEKVNEVLNSYINGIEWQCGGIVVWHYVTPRYNDENKLEFVLNFDE
jgi:hypothetical protein